MKLNKSIKKIVLAAGLSNRFGPENKLLSIINDKALISHTIDILIKTFIMDDIIIVLGHDYQTVLKLINNSEIRYIKNKYFKNGIGTSISAGMSQIDSNTVGVMIIPGDMPFLQKYDLAKLQNKFIELNYSKVVCPQYNSIIGNPIILPKSYFETLKNLNNDFGAKKFLKQEDIVFVETSNATTFDIDTLCDLKKANLHKI